MSENRFRNRYLIPSTRLRTYDYSSSGYYFVTICTKDRQNFFGDIVAGRMRLSEIGHIAQKYWQEIPKHFPFVKLDEFQTMPNHIHGILIIRKTTNHTKHVVETRQCLVSTGINRFQNQGRDTISSIVGSYKSICTKTVNAMKNNISFAWQPRFYDHIIRNETSLNRIRKYIRDNPLNWTDDENNPQVLSKL
jgi:putative transposase